MNATHLFVMCSPLLAYELFCAPEVGGGGREVEGWESIYCTAGALCKPPSKCGGMDK